MNSIFCLGIRRFPRGAALTVVAMLLLVRAAFGMAVAPAAAPDPAPTLTVIGGNDQVGTPGDFNAKPFDIAVWNAAGTEPLVNTEVTFTVQFGGGQLASDNTTLALPNASVTLRTDEDGTVQAYYKQPAIPGILSQIKASVGAAELVLQTTSLAAADSTSDASGHRDDSSTTQSATATSGGGIQLGGAGGSKATMAANAVGKNADAITARALTLAASVVKIRTPASQYYAVNTSTWAITTTTP